MIDRLAQIWVKAFTIYLAFKDNCDFRIAGVTMKITYLLSAAALATLTACGGGEASTPTAPPVSMPSPTPPPVASPSYDPVFAFDADFQNFLLTVELQQAGVIENGRFARQSVSFARDDRAIDKSVLWNATAENITIRYGTEDVLFESSNLGSSVDNGRQWYKIMSEPYRSDAFTITKMESYTYLITAVHAQEYDLTDGTGRRVQKDRYGVGGSFTQISDLPASGIKIYRLSGSSTSPTRDGAGGLFAASQPGTSDDAALSIDFASSTFSVPVYLERISAANGNEPIKISVVLNGTYDAATNRISGTIESTNSQYTGSFGGAFFGPQAEELGIIYSLQHPTEEHVVGKITGDSGGTDI